MCGIAGIFHFSDAGRAAPASPSLLKRMTDAIAHRGPDGEGHFCEEGAGLGHRRLAIIDLSTSGRQPMMSACERYVIVYNGEVYNFSELRVELQGLGISFQSRTDSEVVLEAYARWGEKCLDRLNGMFAFAIYDRKERSLFLARDRYGVKPLYYSVSGNTLVFGSEVKALLASSHLEAELDPHGLLEYLTFQNHFGEETLFKGVKLLPPGNFLRHHADRSQPEQRQYWDFDFREDRAYLRRSEEDLVTELTHKFEQGVVRQLMSDVPVGAYLSGGMDSGSITRIASKNLESLTTFTVGFDMSAAQGIEYGYDERAFAEQISAMSQTTHYEVVLKAGDLRRCMKNLVWHLEEPRVGQCYPNFYAAQLASKFVKVVLGGAGGDELFGGYPWRYYRAVSNSGFSEYVDKYYRFWQRLVPEGQMNALVAPLRSENAAAFSRSRFENVFLSQKRTGLLTPSDYVNLSLYFEAKTFLPGLLMVEDKLAMAHGLEGRFPFLDNDLVQYAQRLPVKYKLANLSEVVRLNENTQGPKDRVYFERNRDGKMLLRRAMERYLPLERTRAVKQGFSGPDSTWFRGESLDYVRELLFDRKARIYDILDYKTATGLVEDHLTGKENRRLLIWSLLYLEEWLRSFKIRIG
jgi:asparagine synthase (glutamine-hydrolysing)